MQAWGVLSTSFPVSAGMGTSRRCHSETGAGYAEAAPGTRSTETSCESRQAWRLTHPILALWRQRQEGSRLQARQPCHKQTEIRKGNKFSKRERRKLRTGQSFPFQVCPDTGRAAPSCPLGIPPAAISGPPPRHATPLCPQHRPDDSS